MFAPRHAPYSNREVCHSLTWHSGKSESALERFEPIAVATLWLDGRGTLFALVAARRQKVFKRGKHSSFCPFRSFRTSEKNTKRKVALCFYGGSKPPPYSQNPNIANKQNKNYTSVFRQRTDFTHARPAFIAGVQTMRARICSAFSCDMFARVV